MSKEQVMDYVMNSPANTNPNVLSGMLDSVAQGGGTVEVIKLGESSTGTSDTSAPFIFNGTITGIDGNQLAEQIGDKSVIGFRFKNLNGQGTNKPFSTMGSVTGNGGTIDLLMNKEAIKYVSQINYIAYFQFAKPNDSATVEVYAICI